MEKLNPVRSTIGNMNLGGAQQNLVSSLIDPVAEMKRDFLSAGWKIDPASGNPGNVISSPDGEITLRQVDGKIWRHSDVTEAICKGKDWTRMVLNLAEVDVPRGGCF